MKMICVYVAGVLGIALCMGASVTAQQESTHSRHESVLTFCIAGDLLLDRGVRTEIRRKGAAALLARIAPVFQGSDYTLVNLECPVTRVMRPLNKKYVFRAEPEWLDALRDAGITHVSLANNHSNDQGRDGVIATAKHAEQHGLRVVGFGNTQLQARRPALLSNATDTVAIFASVFVPLENWMYRAGSPGPSQASVDELAEDMRAWKSAHPHAVAIAFLHWGWEYHTTPTDQQRFEARTLISAGADAIIGHHPHVVQTIEYIDGKPVVYSLGNFVFDNARETASNGLVLQCTVRGGRMDSVRLIPVRIDACVPVPVSHHVGAWLRRFLMKVSPGIRVTESLTIEELNH